MGQLYTGLPQKEDNVSKPQKINRSKGRLILFVNIAVITINSDNSVKTWSPVLILSVLSSGKRWQPHRCLAGDISTAKSKQCEVKSRNLHSTSSAECNRGKMEGKSRAPEITIAPVADGDAVKAAGREPMSPGTPSSSVAATDRGSRSKESRAEGSASLPGWKLDALCQEYSSPPAVRARFLYF